MKTPRTLHATLMVGTATALLLGAGCASSPPTAEKMAAPLMGVVTTFHRKSSGSLGSFDGQVVWTHAPATWQGKPVIAFSAPQAGVSLHDPATFGTIASLNTAGQPVMSYNPPIDYPWPLQVGKSWTANHTVTLYPSQRTAPIKIEGKVESWGDVTVPAGTFKAFKLVWNINQSEFETRWINPDEGLATVKRHVERTATHPQGAGVLDAELLSRVLPAK